MEVIVLSTQSGDWEGLYVNGKLIFQGHSISDNGINYLWKMSEQYNFSRKDIKYKEADDQDEESVETSGNFPEKIKDLNGNY